MDIAKRQLSPHDYIITLTPDEENKIETFASADNKDTCDFLEWAIITGIEIHKLTQK